jgi:hypothetical protein
MMDHKHTVQGDVYHSIPMPSVFLDHIQWRNKEKQAFLTSGRLAAGQEISASYK